MMSTSFAAEQPTRTPAPEGWPEQVNTLIYTASIDASPQPMVMYTAESEEKRPLLIGLHTWGGTYSQLSSLPYARWCIENDWHFAHPDFRGPNTTPQGCGSDRVVQDILDAVEIMTKMGNVDTNRIYLVGASGGGYAALLMAGRHPTLWAGVSAWVPIADLRVWWEQTKAKGEAYANHIERVAGGRPDQDAHAAQACVQRSAITYLDRAAGVNLDINAGVEDGHKGGPVPFTHALYAFNQVVPASDRLDAEWIEAFYREGKLPDGQSAARPDALYGNRQPIFRKISGNTRVTIFQGGHEIIHQAALNWLAQQQKNQPATWDIGKTYDLQTTEQEAVSGR